MTRVRLRKFLYPKLMIGLDTLIRIFGKPGQFDSNRYWRGRAATTTYEDSRSVLWKNIHYDRCLREKEFGIIRRLIEKYDIEKGHALDVGCGIGEVSKFLIELGFHRVDAIDFPEMISLAIRLNPHRNINYIPCPAELYLTRKRYDFIISSESFSAMRNISKMLRAINNAIRMLKDKGYILMIDPFHKSPLLSRARISQDEIIELMERRGLKIIEKSGMLFWPFRILISNDGSLTEYQTRILYNTGEKMLDKLGNIWSDYKVLLFGKG
ncbi:MAG: class I SAM-dependent methyltransferase [Candidatus Bathyarchaeia archaeon]